MELNEQHKLVDMWHAYIGDVELAKSARNADMVSFYLDIVRDSPMYLYGNAYEVFDVLVNGPFDPSAVDLNLFAPHSKSKGGSRSAA